MTYERRYAGVGMERRGQRGPNDAFGVNAYVALFGANLVEMWDSQLGIATVGGNVDTWTGQLGGRVLPAPGAAQRPAYGTDGALFGSKSVVQCATSGTKVLWANNTLSSLAAAGAMPVLIVRFRLRTAAGTQRIAGFGGAGGNRSIEQLGFSATYRGGDITVINDSSGTAVDTAVHTLINYSDASLYHVRIDGVDHTAAHTSTLQAAATFGSVGVFTVDGSSSPADLSCAKILFLGADPGGAALTACEGLLAAEYPP